MKNTSTIFPAETKYRSFEDLEVYKVAREFRIKMYRIAKGLPDFEKFGFASQMRRAAVSLTNNLAEGHGRFHFLDQIRFTLIARGSLEELLDDLNICLDEKYLSESDVGQHKSSGWHLLKLTNGWLRYLRDRKFGTSLALHEPSAADADDSLEWLDALLEEHPGLMPPRIESPVRY
ncbi:MAG: four helix bundle protein [Verrucomicrobiota bacterium]